MPDTALPPWVLPAAAVGIGVLVLAAIVGGPSEDELPPAARRDRAAIGRLATGEEREIRARERKLEQIDAKKEILDERFERVRRQRRDAEAEAARAASPKVRGRTLATIAKLKQREESMSTQQDHLEQKYQDVKTGRVSPRAVLVNPGPGELFGAEPTADTALEKAKAMSQQFLGTPDEVVILDESERKPISKYAMVLGTLTDISYEPAAGTTRDDAIYDHKLGEDLPWEPKSLSKMLLVADPITRRIHLVQNHAATIFDPRWGILK